MAAPVLGGTTLPQPFREGCDRRVAPKGHRIDLANAGVRWQHQGFKYQWTLAWRSLTATDRNTIKGRFEVTSAQTFTDWDGVSGTVITALGSYQETPIPVAGGSLRYDVTITLEEI